MRTHRARWETYDIANLNIGACRKGQFGRTAYIKTKNNEGEDGFDFEHQGPILRAHSGLVKKTFKGGSVSYVVKFSLPGMRGDPDKGWENVLCPDEGLLGYAKFVESLDKKIMQNFVENSEAWFGKVRNEVWVKDEYRALLWKSSEPDLYSPTIEGKLLMNGSDISMTIFDVKGNKYNPEDLLEPFYAIPIFQLKTVSVGQAIGTKFVITQLVVVPDHVPMTTPVEGPKEMVVDLSFMDTSE